MRIATFLLLFGTGLLLSSALVTVAGAGRMTQSAASVISFLLPSLTFAYIYGRPSVLNFLGFKKPLSWEMYVLPTVCILAAFPAAIWLNDVNHMLPAPAWMVEMEQDADKHTKALLQGGGVMMMLLNLVVMALVPAICEEVCFRGVIQRLAIRSFNMWTGIIVTSLFFSILHLQFQGFLPRFFFSVILGAMYCYSGTIWPSISAHFVANAVQVIAVMYLPDFMNSNPSVPIVWVCVGIFVVVITMFRMKHKFSTADLLARYRK